MAERELTRQKEAEAKPKGHYETILEEWALLREKAKKNMVVIRNKEVPWQQNQQALVKFFLFPTITDTANRDWMMFVQDIRNHSGRHRHQGGLALFVLEGKGWTVVDGERFDWEEGDLILLPVKPNGVVHQHYNAEQGKPCKWLALIYTHFMGCTGFQMEQEEKHPEYGHA